MAFIEAYVTNLGKYNEGELASEPLKFPTTTEEVQALLKRIGVDNIQYEEIFIADYGGDLPESISIQMDQQTANRLFHTKREGSQVGLELDGRVIPAQIKEKKKMMSGQVEHFGFQALSADKKVNSVTHIFLKNTELVPGTLEQMLFEVPFASLPADMIDTVTVDLDGMPAGTTVTVKDIPEFQSDKIELQIDADSMVLRIVDKKRAVEEDA